MTPHLETKLPKIGTTIFTVMSALAQENNAVNLGQGFPDFHCDPKLVDAVSTAMNQGLNQYPSMLGVLELRNEIAKGWNGPTSKRTVKDIINDKRKKQAS